MVQHARGSAAASTPGRASLRSCRGSVRRQRVSLLNRIRRPRLSTASVRMRRDALRVPRAPPGVDHAAASSLDHAPAEPETCRRPRTCRPLPGRRWLSSWSGSGLRSGRSRVAFVIAVEVRGRGRGSSSRSRSGVAGRRSRSNKPIHFTRSSTPSSPISTPPASTSRRAREWGDSTGLVLLMCT